MHCSPSTTRSAHCPNHMACSSPKLIVTRGTSGIATGSGSGSGPMKRSPSGGEAWPNSSSPQQTSRPSPFRIAHVWFMPALMAENRWDLGQGWGNLPQQFGVPFAHRPQPPSPSTVMVVTCPNDQGYLSVYDIGHGTPATRKTARCYAADQGTLLGQ